MTEHALAAKLDHVTLTFDKIRALDDLSLEIPEGQRLCILGANGSGKSTLASVLCGLLAPDEGTVELIGYKVLDDRGVDFETYRKARRDLGLVFQNPGDQIVTTVVADEVAFGPENLGLPSEEIGKRVREELHRVAMEPYAQADPTRLSGGQQQRVAIASALAMHPKLLVFDEPGALLDVRGRHSIMKVMDQLRDEGITLVHITHFMEEALAADRVIVLSHGSIILDGTPEEVFSHTDQIRSVGLTEPFAARLSAQLTDSGIAWTASESELIHALTQRIQPASPEAFCFEAPTTPTKVKTSDAPQITVDDVSYRYFDTSSRRHPALQDLNLTFDKGSTTAIIGQTGSGKSTLARLLCALEVPDSGTITVEGIRTDEKRQRRKLHGHIGYVMQHPERQLFAQTVAEDVAYGPHNMGLSEEEVNKRVSQALETVGMQDKAQYSPFELSGGQKRLCALAGVLAMNPPILVLDEPTAGLDPAGRAELTLALKRACEAGVTLIEITHSMEDAARFEQVVVLNESRVIAQGSPREIFTPKHQALLHNCGLGLPHALRFALALGETLKKQDILPVDTSLDTFLGAPLTLEALATALH